MRSLASHISRAASPRVPARWRQEVERVLIDDAQIASRVRQLARAVTRDFVGRELVVVALLNGTIMFLADLLRHLSLPLRLDFIGVSSYGLGTESADLVFTKELRLEVRGRDVLLVDDILDTGKTICRVLAKLEALRPRRIKVCVLLNKSARRTEKVVADYVGFEIPDVFVVGYGLDFAERYRNLPFIGVLRPDVYQPRADVRPALRPSNPQGRARRPAARLAELSRRRRGGTPRPTCTNRSLPHFMLVSICFYSYFKELSGCAQVSEEVPPGTTLGQLFERVIERFPKLAPMRKSTLMAIGLEYQDRGYLLKEGDQISFFPPVQGG